MLLTNDHGKGFIAMLQKKNRTRYNSFKKCVWCQGCDTMIGQYISELKSSEPSKMIFLQLKDGINNYTLKSHEKLNIENVKKFVHKTTGKCNIIIMKDGVEMEDNAVINESMEVVIAKLGCGIDKCRIKAGKDLCKWCSIAFCAKHRLPEEHVCNKLTECRKSAAEKNKSVLNKHKVEYKKMKE